MPDSNSKKKWDKANVVFVTTKLFRKPDADILEYLEEKAKDGIARGAVVKKALRFMANSEKQE